MSYLVSTKPYKLIAINISSAKGMPKQRVSKAFVGKTGIADDIHASISNRQISMLPKAKFDLYCEQNKMTLPYGAFGENLIYDGNIVPEISKLDRFKIGDEVIVEVTYNKILEHDDTCEYCKDNLPCSLIDSGIFVRVVQEGFINEGCKIVHQPKLLRFHIITISDRVSRGEYDDRSGMRIIKALNEYFIRKGYKISISQTIIPDESDQLKSVLENSIQQNIDFIFTTGGTGIGPRDITPEIIRPMLDKEMPGIMEAARIKLSATHPLTLLSRNFAGIIDKSLIYLLPGSYSIIPDYMQELIPSLEGTMFMMHGLDIHQ